MRFRLMVLWRRNNSKLIHFIVTPAQAGAMLGRDRAEAMKYGGTDAWIPAFAGMTKEKRLFSS
jgi:hypothetical protein